MVYYLLYPCQYILYAEIIEEFHIYKIMRVPILNYLIIYLSDAIYGDCTRNAQKTGVYSCYSCSCTTNDSGDCFDVFLIIMMTMLRGRSKFQSRIFETDG